MAKRLNQRWIIREVYKRGATYYINIRDDWSGKVYRRSTSETNKKRSEQFALDWVADHEARERADLGGRVTFDAAYEEFLGDLNVRPITMEGYRRDFEGIYRPHFGGKFIDEITKRNIKDFLNRRKTLKARTRQKHLTALRSFFRWAVDEDYIPTNPCGGVKVGRGEKRTGIAITPEESRRLLCAAREKYVGKYKDKHRLDGWTQEFEPPKHLYVALVIALLTGLRCKNVKEMTWRHNIDLEKRQISFSAEEMKGKAAHSVPINSQLAEFLRTLPVDLTKPLVGQSIKTSFKGACERAGLPDLTFHDLRHTWSTWLTPKCSYPCLRALMAHSPGGDVTLHYAHVPWEEKVKAVEALPNLLGIKVAVSGPYG